MYLGRAGQELTENVCLDRPVQNGLSCGLCGSVWLCPELSRTKCFADAERVFPAKVSRDLVDLVSLLLPCKALQDSATFADGAASN